MTRRRLLLTVSYDRSLHAIALAELLVRDGHQIAGVLVVTPLRLRRLRHLLRQRGPRALPGLLRRLVGLRSLAPGGPMQELLDRERIDHRSLRVWARERGVPYHVVPGLNDQQAVNSVSAARVDAVVYAGGGILGRAFLAAARGMVLNAHSGPLPYIRGMNALEWSLLLGRPPTVTIHAVDRGIDTGGVLEAIAVPISPGDTIDDLREKCLVLGVEGLRRASAHLDGPLPERAPDAESHRQCYVLSPALRELLALRLERMAGSQTSGGQHR